MTKVFVTNAVVYALVSAIAVAVIMLWPLA